MKYPHLLKNERKIWDRYLNKHCPRFCSIWYDVHLGTNSADCFKDEESKRMWGHLVKKRVDVLFLIDDVYTVCEVKHYAGVSAIGQVLAYRELLIRDWYIPNAVDTLIVTDYALPDMHWLCGRFNINIVEV